MMLRSTGLALGLCLALATPVLAQDPESLFHRAYFLEHEQGSLEAARKLYEDVAASSAASPALQADARTRASALAEADRASDLAALMPPGAVLYAELAHPGESLVRLLEGFGLTGSLEEAAARGGFTVRPESVRALAGIRALAIGLTRLPQNGNAPGGVLIADAGDVEILRGALEAGILARGTPAASVHGVPTWSLPQGIHVALGQRLVVVSDRREEVEGVLARLADPAAPSLAQASGMKARLAERGDGPAFVCVDAAPLVPLLKAQLAAQGDPGVAALSAALDLDHLEALTGRLQIDAGGLSLDCDLFLAEGHRNLVFNLMRKVPIDPALLDRIPAGAAAFAAFSFNERGPALAPLERNADGAPVVTALDFGRELFANLAGACLFVVPGGAPIPSAALLLSSNDPARTEAVLGLLLGLANVTGGSTLDGQADEIDGAPTRVYRLPPGIPLYLTRLEDGLILSPSQELIESALEARSSGRSVLRDEAFQSSLGQLDKDTTLAVCAHAGRVLATAQPYLQGEQREHLRPFAEVLDQTVVVLRQHHSATRLSYSLALQGLPKIDLLLGQALARQRAEGGQVALRSLPATAQAPRAEALMPRFARLAAREGGAAEARALARQELAGMRDDPRALNNFAWALLTEPAYAARFDDLALEFARVANEVSGSSVWQYLDTQAFAEFRAGNTAEAIALEERALEHVESSSDRGAMEASLARFRAARAQALEAGSARVAEEKRP